MIVSQEDKDMIHILETLKKKKKAVVRAWSPFFCGQYNLSILLVQTAGLRW